MPADLVSVITGDAAVAAIIGDRIYPLVVPQQVFDGDDKRPCIVYRTSFVGRQPLFCATDELKSETFAFDCYALTYDGAIALADALRSALLDYNGVSSGTSIQTVQLQGEFDLGDFEPGLYRRHLDFIVWHRSN